MRFTTAFVASAVTAAVGFQTGAADKPRVEIVQVTHGPRHHFFGYIGQCRTSPWNRAGAVVGLRTTFQDRMPQPDDAADIVLLNAPDAALAEAVDQTRAWNFQQGSMMYWAPQPADAPGPERLIFNDRDPGTGKIFAVSWDPATRTRAREYRFDDVPVGNGGVRQQGGAFAAINYGRLARLRPVTGYPGAFDPTEGVRHPENDGVFVVDLASGERRLLVSFARMADALRPARPDVERRDLFVNHTLWSRGGERIFFFARADFALPRGARIDAPMVVDADGGNLRLLPHHFGGHPEWLDDRRVIGRDGDRQAVYDVLDGRFVRSLGGPEVFPDPEGDIALSPGGDWLVNGWHDGAETRYVFYRMADGLVVRSPPVSNAGMTRGDLRIDPAPCWNREGTAVLVPAAAADGTRQMFLLRLHVPG